MSTSYAPPAVARHLTHPDDLAGVAVQLPPAGMVLGSGENGPLVVRLFRASPVRVCVVSTGALAQLVAYRAVALGAHVTVVTDQAGAWSRLVAAIPRGPGWLSVLPPGARVNAVGSTARPSLVIDATEDHRSLPRWEQSEWQTLVSVQRELGADAQTSLRSYDLVATQRLAPGPADLVRRAFWLSQDRAAWLTQMPPDVVAVAAGGQLAFGQVAATAAEQALFTR